MILLEKVGNLINYVGVQDDVLLKDISQVIEVLELFHKVVKHCFGLTLNPAQDISIQSENSVPSTDNFLESHSL